MKEFVDEASRILGAKRDLVETDVLLHLVLRDLSGTGFKKEFAFKGGSCLIKHYLGYYRFSVDLDFTFWKQEMFEGKSQKEIRKLLSGRIDDIMGIFTDISGRRGLDFKAEKENRRYMEFGGGNKSLTLKLWRESPFSGETFIKIQINFVDRLLFPLKEAELESLIGESRELQFLFPSLYEEYSTPVRFKVYDIREILCEKVRAVLTRRGVKERDFLDLYLISKKFKLSYEDSNHEIIEKTRFALNLYQKYRENMKENLELLSIESFPFGSEDYLLLEDIDRDEFRRFVEGFIEYIKEIGCSLQ
ncbi:MAG: nucleotidyl transferase AbiEii/AbiGii toxin family protein [Candidatus Altiarchaeales archaeon]|nr:nucleotidyl transferase AbiEii/AbiGii toxin family protein [Candidatus Altiarchaeota archaeon]MBU4266722.1 nucleotidyl transferase AbiEii/AbiGii toxin family protein [Candidatus Altiarchaeota archaeon]MBU4342040.1 nucleotidyl transferase AbiEii/AbiGii toxin family protein [Candidatus Altiarchaeota archaeon]MBU4437677.1 nucleotidyl transferase AbiEii/AbiGii toxin family protein [Candidatus Altiarchaeota archaeon]MCG2783127.1 nucleotidyl transferase AbiEii/AbiGii toxin family protein [Candidat